MEKQKSELGQGKKSSSGSIFRMTDNLSLDINLFGKRFYVSLGDSVKEDKDTDKVRPAIGTHHATVSFDTWWPGWEHSLPIRGGKYFGKLLGGLNGLSQLRTGSQADDPAGEQHLLGGLQERVGFAQQQGAKEATESGTGTPSVGFKVT